MNLGGYPAPPSRRPGLRAAVNARLEEISFRTGLITAAIALVALIAAAGFYAATLGDGSATVTVSAGNVPKTAPKAPAATLTKPATPSATATPKSPKPVPGRTTSPRPAAAPQSQATDSATAGSQGYGRNSYGHGQGYGGQDYDGRGYDGQGSGGQGFGGYGFRHGAHGLPRSGGFPDFGRGWGRQH